MAVFGPHGTAIEDHLITDCKSCKKGSLALKQLQTFAWASAGMLLIVSLSGAFAECVPIDPVTHEVCIKLVSHEQDNQFTNIRWSNRCSIAYDVKWSSDKMGLTETVLPHGTLRTQCYSYCNNITWHAICKEVDQNLEERSSAARGNVYFARGPELVRAGQQ